MVLVQLWLVTNCSVSTQNEGLLCDFSGSSNGGVDTEAPRLTGGALVLFSPLQ